MICFGSSSLNSSHVSVEPLLRVLGRLAGVLAARLDVEVHLAHLERPLDDRVEVLLLDLAVGAQAEVVRQLADLVRARVRLGLLEHLAQEALAEVARLLELLLVDARDELRVVLVDLRLLDEQAVEHAVDVLRDRALLGARSPWRAPCRAALSASRIWIADVGDRLQLLRRQPAVVADRRVADELADLLRVLGRDLRRRPRGRASTTSSRASSSGGMRLLLGPVRQAADPELVVLVEVPLLALREVLAAPLEPVLERGERLVAVDVDLLASRPRPCPRGRSGPSSRFATSTVVTIEAAK